MTERSAGTASAQEANPIRSSFSMGRYEREAIRRAAEWYGTTQGNVVDMAPLLYALVADLSLERRRERLPGIRSLADQAIRSIESIRSTAPHLGWAIDWTVRTVQEICEIEELAISNRWIHGVEIGDSDFDFIRAYNSDLEWSDEAPPSPFVETLKQLWSTASSNALPHIEEHFDEEWSIHYRCCEGTRERDLRQKLGNYLAELVITGELTEKEAEQKKRAGHPGDFMADDEL
jgi:hypothetical protein